MGFDPARVQRGELCNYFAVGMCIQNWTDSSTTALRLPRSRESRKWEMIPWDLDKDLGRLRRGVAGV